MALVSQGRVAEVRDALFARLVHRERREDAALRAVLDLMAQEVGTAAYLRQQSANIGRADSRPTARRHPLPDAGAGRRQR